MTNTVPFSPPRSARGAALSRAVTVAAAVLLALAVWVVAVPVLGVDLRVTPGGAEAQTVGAVSVLVVSLLAGLAGWVLLAVLVRVTRRARRWWTGFAVALLVVSLTGPLTSAVGAAAKTVLVVLHLVVGVVLLVGFRRSVKGGAAGPRGHLRAHEVRSSNSG